MAELLQLPTQIRTHRGGFQFMVIMTPQGGPFHPVVVIGLVKNLLLKSVLGHCGIFLSVRANLLCPLSHGGPCSIVQFLRANNHATESTETFRNLFVACRILRSSFFTNYQKAITVLRYGILLPPWKYSFSNFSCMFLSPNIFFQFEL